MCGFPGLFYVLDTQQEVWWIFSSRLKGDLCRSSEVFFAFSTASSFLIQCSGDLSNFGLPQTRHFIFLTQRDCCTLTGITLPALQPGNTKQWAGAINVFASTFSLTTVLPYTIDQCPTLSDFQCLKNTFIHFVQIFSCFKRKHKSHLFYSILARSKSPLERY